MQSSLVALSTLVSHAMLLIMFAAPSPQPFPSLPTPSVDVTVLVPPTRSSSSGVLWSTPTVVVGLLALAFAVASFWFLNARRGKIKSFKPHTFAAFSDEAHMRLRLPLVIHNTGAAVIVVQNLRLYFPDEPHSVLSLPWAATWTELEPRADGKYDYPAVFSIDGRKAVQMFVEFAAPFPGFVLGKEDYTVVIKAKLGHKKHQKEILMFTLHGSGIFDRTHYLTCKNTPEGFSGEDPKKLEAIIEALIKNISKPD